jgi:hypothetical protein
MNDTDLKVVAAAFDRLLDKIEASACSSDDWHTVGLAKIDVLNILAGKWDEEEEPVDSAGQWGTF